MPAKKQKQKANLRLVPENARIVLLVKDNPRRQGTEAARRARAVMSSRTVQDALKKGAKTSTVRHLAESRVIRLVRPVAKKRASK